MDDIPGGLPNSNSIATNKEMHESLHQQILKNAFIDRGFFLINTFRQPQSPVNSSNLNLLFLSRTTYTTYWVPQIFFFLWCIYLGNLLKLLQKYICSYLSILFSSLFSPIHPQCKCRKKNHIFQLYYGFIYLVFNL